ncbi:MULTISPECIES: hypothetical protein [unclassified Clostridium]|uniref:hypothetical protein n=1 Tax=unclassified Clostridium TaxID=2614128 RepID=UPI00023B0049|nr:MULTISPECIES: hypothetical protein [unclassified Clostridium]EHI99786.1 hypothetical protein CDLVIII_3212 [Clostridium sp. DL-VIII]OOM80000.1 hypothetical protein CLOBL_10480 [Clostridium sp. BL-8]
MDKNIYELLKDIELHSDNINNWEQITNAFVNAIKRKGLTKEQVVEMNNRILKEVSEEMRSEKEIYL